MRVVDLPVVIANFYWLQRQTHLTEFAPKVTLTLTLLFWFIRW